MVFFAIVGFSLYLLIKRSPEKCKSMLVHANNMVKYMPIDKSSLDMLSPILDFTGGSSGGSHFMYVWMAGAWRSSSLA